MFQLKPMQIVELVNSLSFDASHGIPSSCDMTLMLLKLLVYV